MKTWDEMIKRLEDRPKVNTHEIVVDGQKHQARAYAVEGIDKEMVMQDFTEKVSREIGDNSDVYVRVMPEISQYENSDRYIAYARLVVIPKVIA
ncbi:hypothetical protein [Paenibacillus naphthalenovorans]|uniref:hypothetical protein n=1 Tax=Paenibacillus naphthalenovorans TaxID=162209 RepID=UPI000942278E|nr:hypothetical protein [Paenibacillus naphthalenovorans]